MIWPAWQITAREWIDAVAIRSDGHDGDGFVGWWHDGMCGFCAHLKRFPTPLLDGSPLPREPATIFVDFCNESDTRVARIYFPKRFSPLLSFIADVREKQSLSPNLERS